MKRSLSLPLLTLALSIFGFAISANAQYMAQCMTSANVNSGNSAYIMDMSQGPCDCSQMWCTGDYYASWGTCSHPYQDFGATVSGQRCCHNTFVPCKSDGEKVAAPETSEVISTNPSESLADVFEPRNGDYFGIVNLISRSPQYGRANATSARLDICMGHNNTPSSYADCVSKCGDGSKNDKCTENSSAVCLDRCKCEYNQSGCSGL